MCLTCWLVRPEFRVWCCSWQDKPQGATSQSAETTNGCHGEDYVEIRTDAMGLDRSETCAPCGGAGVRCCRFLGNFLLGGPDPINKFSSFMAK